MSPLGLFIFTVGYSALMIGTIFGVIWLMDNWPNNVKEERP